MIALPPYLILAPTNTLEALAVNNGGTGFVVLLFRAPQVLEGGKRSQDRTTDPDGVLPLGRSDDLDLYVRAMSSQDLELKRVTTNLHARRGKGDKLLLHAVSDTREHSGTTGQHDVSVQITTNIEIALVNRVVSRFVNAVSFKAEHGRLEEGLRSAESGIIQSGNEKP